MERHGEKREIIILPNTIHQMQYTKCNTPNTPNTITINKLLLSNMHSYEPNIIKKDPPWQVAIKKYINIIFKLKLLKQCC